VRAYGVMGHELVGNLFCERGTTAVALLSTRMTRASQVRIRLAGGGKKLRTLGPGSERTEAFRENEAVIARTGDRDSETYLSRSEMTLLTCWEVRNPSMPVGIDGLRGCRKRRIRESAYGDRHHSRLRLALQYTVAPQWGQK
jgi:hypothetical protein